MATKKEFTISSYFLKSLFAGFFLSLLIIFIYHLNGEYSGGANMGDNERMNVDEVKMGPGYLMMCPLNDKNHYFINNNPDLSWLSVVAPKQNLPIRITDGIRKLFDGHLLFIFLITFFIVLLLYFLKYFKVKVK